MNLVNLENAKNAFTGKASDGARQFAFAGIAVIWLLRIEKSALPIPPKLAPILVLFAVVLACDLLQYTISSWIWAAYYRMMLRKNLAKEADFEEPAWLPMPGYFLFNLKILVLFAAWLWLAEYLVELWQLAR